MPWAESGMITLWRSSPWASCQARMSSRPVSSPAAPAAGCRVAAAMPVISHSGLFQLDQQLQPALGQRGRRRRVDVGQAGQAGHGVADLGVVLHGARPERVGAEVDRELPVAQPGEVGHQVALGHLGQRQRRGAAMVGRDQLLERPLGDAGRPQLPAPPPGLRQLEEGRLGVAPEQRGARGPAAGGRRARRGRRSSDRTALSRAATKASISARVRRSVTATSRPCRRRRRHRAVALVADQVGQRHAGQESLVGQALDHHRRPGTGRAEGELPQTGVRPVERCHPGDAEQRRRGSSGCPGRSAGATSASPAVPSHPSWTAAVTAIRVWLVQTLDVAFSRRMSCSRARSVVT